LIVGVAASQVAADYEWVTRVTVYGVALLVLSSARTDRWIWVGPLLIAGLLGTIIPGVMPRTVTLWTTAGWLAALTTWLMVLQQIVPGERVQLTTIRQVTFDAPQQMLRPLPKRNATTLARYVSLCVVWVASVVPVSAHAPDLSRYREFHLGMSMATVTEQVGPTPEVRLVHQRPALIQELTWYPPRSSGALPDEEAVRQVVFTFYEGELCRMVIEYDRQRTEGLTVDDMLEALAVKFGPATRPRVVIMASLSEGSHLSDEILANWQDSRSALTLFRPSYLSTFGLMVTDRRLDRLARRATDAALRLDAQEAPQRDEDRKLAQGEEERVRLAKARQSNKGTFRP